MMTEAFQGNLVLVCDNDELTLARLVDLPVRSNVGTVSSVGGGETFRVTIRDATFEDRRRGQEITAEPDRIQWVGIPLKGKIKKVKRDKSGNR